ncbi:MAG: TonB-dependent receptor [Rhodocyclaceae bacterium]|nr:TonB-dependent receptor [Rhodocyclaceae bacterium]
MILKKKQIAVFVGHACAAISMVASSGSAFAQAAPNTERITVTGSRIPQPQTDNVSPVTVLSSEDIKTDGFKNVDELLNQLPQVFADQTNKTSNGATGTANLNLRGLGTDRTLTLINGRRMPPGSPRNFAADVTQIPAGLVERVDVLTGGASAVYGADAVAGVVNFIMKQNFEGVQVDIGQTFYNHRQHDDEAQFALRERGITIPGNADSDGKSSDVSILFGGNFANNKGNATGYFTYKHDEELRQDARDYSACAYFTSDTDATPVYCGGSGTAFPARVRGLSAATGALTGGQMPGATPGTIRPRTAADVFNFAPDNFYQRPGDTHTFGLFAHYDFSEKAKAYSELAFHNYHTNAQIAASGAFGSNVQLSDENPLLSTAWKDYLFPGGLSATKIDGDGIDQFATAVINRRNIEGGPRGDNLEHTSFRSVFGLKGDLNKDWKYDVSVQYAKIKYTENYVNDVSATRIARALDVVSTANGPACRTAVSGADTSCVPWDIFNIGGVTPAAVKYISAPGFETGETTQKIYSATFSGDLGAYGIKMPLAKRGVSTAVGAEYRKETLGVDTDFAYQQADLFGQGAPKLPYQASMNVTDIFGELRIPLIEDREFAKSMNLSLSYRSSDFSDGNNPDTYGLGLDWTPVKAVKLRGSYQRSVRAPNLIDAFQPQQVQLDTYTDPCAGDMTVPGSPTPAQCANTGVTAVQYGNVSDNPAGQYNAKVGGAKTQPESADSYTFGIVLQPMQNLTATIDYFDIKVNKLISTIPAAISMSDCLAGVAAACARIKRDPFGSLYILGPNDPAVGFIETLNTNIGFLHTTGYDIGANYNYRLGAMGNLNFTLNGTALKTLVTSPQTGVEYDCAGYHGNAFCGTPNPKWRHKFRTSWSTPWNVDLALTWRHISKVEHEARSSDADLNGTYPLSPRDFELAARDYFDLAAAYRLNDTFTLYGGINNLMDKDPPTGDSTSSSFSSFANGNTYPQVYDSLGRFVHLSISAKF